jgi:ubiquinone/menaquinone biosynthesis C-methylase UbiE
MYFWNRYHRNFSRFQDDSPTYHLLGEEIEKEIPSESMSEILDLGCGTGLISSVVIQKGRHKITGIDFSSDAVIEYRKRVREATVLCHNLNEPLPFDEQSFDNAICVNTLYALGDSGIKNVLVEAFRILKQNGLFVCSDPMPSFSNVSIVASDFRLRRSKLGVRMAVVHLLGALPNYAVLLCFNLLIDWRAQTSKYRYYAENEYKALFLRAGFEIVNYRQSYNEQNHLIVARKRAGNK